MRQEAPTVHRICRVLWWWDRDDLLYVVYTVYFSDVRGRILSDNGNKIGNASEGLLHSRWSPCRCSRILAILALENLLSSRLDASLQQRFRRIEERSSWTSVFNSADILYRERKAHKRVEHVNEHEEEEEEEEGSWRRNLERIRIRVVEEIEIEIEKRI